MDERICPMCKGLEQPRYMKKGVGELEQSGQTHIPTTTWTCECGYKTWEPARSTPWKNDIVKDPFTGALLLKPRD